MEAAVLLGHQKNLFTLSVYVNSLSYLYCAYAVPTFCCICIQLKESKNKVHSPFLRFSRYPALNTDVSSWAATAGDC